jgi:hypothetical protein
MKRFLALYMAPAAEFEKIMTTFTPEQMQEGMDEWMKWMKAHQTHLADNGAAPWQDQTCRCQGEHEYEK